MQTFSKTLNILSFMSVLRIVKVWKTSDKTSFIKVSDSKQVFKKLIFKDQLFVKISKFTKNHVFLLLYIFFHNIFQHIKSS